MSKSPIATLREGIVGGKWSLVCEGYALLTGEKLSPPAGAPDEVALLRHIALVVRNYAEVDSVPAAPPMAWGDDLAELDGAFDEVGPEPPASPEPEPEPPQTDDGVDAQARAAASRSGRRLPDFSIEHKGSEGEVESDKGRKCRVLPMDTGPALNRFVDKRTVAKEAIPESVKLSESFAGKEYRDAFKPVSVTCCRCGKQESVHPDLVPRRLDPQDEATSYICNKCIGRPKREG